MCTAVILRRPGASWPLLFAGNRDEMDGRPWRAPNRHWPDRGEVVAGLDVLSDGSWMGVNDHGLLAAVLNTPDTLGPAPDKRSRGELVLEALDHAEAREAADALADIEPRAYRGFHLIVADAHAAYWLRHPGESGGNGAPGPGIQVAAIPEGLSMLTAHDLNDTESSRRMARYLPRFAAAPPPDPDAGDWAAWERLLGEGPGDDDTADPEAARAAMCFRLNSGFGTVCASLVGVPARPRTLDEVPRGPHLRFAAGPPGTTPFRDIMSAA